MRAIDRVLGRSRGRVGGGFPPGSPLQLGMRVHDAWRRYGERLVLSWRFPASLDAVPALAAGSATSLYDILPVIGCRGRRAGLPGQRAGRRTSRGADSRVGGGGGTGSVVSPRANARRDG